MRHLKDVREFITELKAIGEVQTINAEVDWNLEIGAVIRRSYDLRAPAPLFTNIAGYQGSGFRVLGAPAGLSGLAHPLPRIARARASREREWQRNRQGRRRRARTTWNSATDRARRGRAVQGERPARS
jgi:3-polyprenyl-4-hydroxybenzoate decarboxylase